MLPSHLQQQPKRRVDTASPKAQPQCHVPLGLTGVVCRSATLSRGARGSLHYTIYRPNYMHSSHQPPLICVAGGPGLPCPYLSPLVHLVEDRALVLYDHVGCGQSTATGKNNNAESVYNLQEMVQDLACLMDTLDCGDYHLFGHSFGGILVYEYVVWCNNNNNNNNTTTTMQPSKKKTCLSVTLASTPVSVALVEASCQLLLEQIRHDHPTDDDDDESSQQQIHQIFSHRHECRVQPLPLQLHQSYVLAGVRSTSSGFQRFRDYVATTRNHVGTMAPAALILRGEHDFCTSEACHGWTDLLEHSEFVTLAGCAHYGMLENEPLFGSVVSSFLRQHEPPPKPLVFSKHARK
jgi:proline-specific peptidase